MLLEEDGLCELDDELLDELLELEELEIDSDCELLLEGEDDELGLCELEELLLDELDEELELLLLDDELLELDADGDCELLLDDEDDELGLCELLLLDEELLLELDGLAVEDELDDDGL